jgi:hypothetical protein
VIAAAWGYLRGRATLPVRVISSTPKEFIRSRNFPTLLSLPVISMVRRFGLHVHDLGAENVRDLHHLGARLGIHAIDLHEDQFAVHVFALAEILHLEHVRQLVELLDDLFERGVVAVRDDGHARMAGSCVGRDIERVNVVAAPAEKPGHAREHAELVFHQEQKWYVA